MKTRILVASSIFSASSTSGRSHKSSVRATLVVALLSACLLASCATERVVDEQPGLLYQTINPGAHPAFKDVVKKSADADLAQVAVTFDAALESVADFRLDLDFTVRDKGLSVTEGIWTETTTLLLTLYPSTCGRYELELTGDLYDRDGNRLKTWHLAEQDTAFLWLFRGKDCGSEQSEITVKKIATRMLEQLYSRMSREGVLSGKEIVPVDNFPLVYVATRNAKSVVQRVTKTYEPFPNFTFDPNSRKTADRILNIRFEFITPEQSMTSILGRGAGAMMTLGLVSMCPPNEMVLQAEVLANGGTVLRTYRFAKKKRAGGLDCVATTDKTHPDLAANLLRKLFRQIKKDKLI